MTRVTFVSRILNFFEFFFVSLPFLPRPRERLRVRTSKLNMPGSSRSFTFVYNNYDDAVRASVEAFAACEHCTYLCYGLEVAPTTGTPHIQGFLRVRDSMRVTTLGNRYGAEFPWLRHCHFEIANGSLESNKAYCFKTRPQDPEPNAVTFEHDNRKQGKRTDLDDAIDTLNSGGIRAVMEQHAGTFVKYPTGFNLLAQNALKPRDWNTKQRVWWWYGTTGTGKTRAAFELAYDSCVSIWKSSKNLRWWNDYRQQTIALIDDFRKDFCTFHELLTILDRYPHSVEVKGGHVPLNSEVIIVTSCYPPWRVYDTREDVDQLLRRIDQVVRFTQGDGEIAHDLAEVVLPSQGGLEPCHVPVRELRLDDGFRRFGPGKPLAAYAPGFTPSADGDGAGVPSPSLGSVQAPADPGLSTDELIALFMED